MIEIEIVPEMVTYLTAAIIERAAEDYIDVKARFKRPTRDCNIRELRQFFRSDWYSFMCSIDGEYAIKMLDQRSKTMVLKYDIRKEKGSNRYYVIKIGGDGSPIPDTFGKKDKAMHKAAELNDLDYKYWLKVRKREYYT